jgi:UDP-N-acetylglucosamine 2-epimerase (non-hydrolysing)
MLICNVVGARPNFMKMAPLVIEMKKRHWPQILVHTGQHYDPNMASVFFDELGMPLPDIYLRVGSDTHARQTARIMTAFDKVCDERQPDLVVVAGDVNSTVAAALVAAKRDIPLAHVEAGLRSFDRTMPEEVNRVVTDSVSDLLFTTESSANENLLKEGISAERIFFTGNCMIDTLLSHVQAAVSRSPWEEFGVEPGRYALLTLHRPSNVDCPESLSALLGAINGIAERIPVIFPAHPRTMAVLERSGFLAAAGLRLREPLSYLPFLGLMARAAFVMTDSGGIQEETTALGVPCLTLRNNTERPATLTAGTNRLVGNDLEYLRRLVDQILAGEWPKGEVPALWDGRAAQRIAGALERWKWDRPSSSVVSQARETPPSWQTTESDRLPHVSS